MLLLIKPTDAWESSRSPRRAILFAWAFSLAFWALAIYGAVTLWSWME